MKIIDLKDPLKRIVDVYAIYWVSNPALSLNGKRIHLAGPYDGYDALIAVSEDNAEIIDASVDGFFLKKSSDGFDMLVHWAALDGGLLDSLTEHNPEAIAELNRRLREDKPPF